MSELSTKDLHVLSHNYYNVPGIKAVDKNGNTHTYTNLKKEILNIENNGIYVPPEGSAYETVAINVQDTTGGFDLTTWAGLGRLAASGYAPYMLEVGGIINGTLTAEDGTTYDYPWIIVDFRDVELQSNAILHNVPILQAQYVYIKIQHFDGYERTVATEETAQEGYYYFNQSYTPLNLTTGSSIPYEDNTTIYKTMWNAAEPIQNGNSRWMYSTARQWLNGNESGWWTKQYATDAAGWYNSAKSFPSLMPSDMIANIRPVKTVTNVKTIYGGGTDVTYDRFWLASLSEMNLANNAEGAPWEYYKQILNSETPVSSSGTYPAMIRYGFSNSTAYTWWTRTIYSNNLWVTTIGTSGKPGGNPAYTNSYHWLPCCALTGA